MKKLALESKQISDLTDEEIKLINYLGLALEEKKHSKSYAQMPKEYDLVITKHCKLCSSSEVNLYHMTLDREHRCLVAVSVEAVSDKYRTKTYKINSCCKCRNYLMSKTIDEVVDLFMTYLNRRFYET